MTEKARTLKITIRNPHSRYRKNNRVFDIVMSSGQAYFEVKVDKDRSERIPITDVIQQVETATAKFNMAANSQSTTAT